ncbi:MAG: JAB domain-containing protein [Pirellulaceae bacterium]|nr:JAB domain-containing protein [Pirellulaceae bacterium]
MTKKTKQNSDRRIDDRFIREVRVNYLTTTSRKFKISEPEDVAEFVRSILVDNSREQFVALYLDASHSVASYSIISIGSANQATVHPREIFQRAVLIGAIAITIAHNHPSDSLTPSNQDIALTKSVKECGNILGIAILDHVIVSSTSHVSLRMTTDLWNS